MESQKIYLVRSALFFRRERLLIKLPISPRSLLSFHPYLINDVDDFRSMTLEDDAWHAFISARRMFDLF
jgi:hypothetical protein